MALEIALDPLEAVPGRPFTDPAHTARDQGQLRQLLSQERALARSWAADPSAAPRDGIVRDRNGEGFRHLLVVPDVDALLEAENPTVVGFFGRPRADVDDAHLFALEDELVAGMAEAEGLLSYYDVEFVKGAYGNLILFAAPDGPGKWRENAVHRRAVELSPASYHEIRLHQGSLTGRFLGEGNLRITRTRYLDYSGRTTWRAVRETPA